MWNTEHSSSGSVPRKRRGSITDPTQEDRPRRRSSVLTPHDGQPLSHRASMFESPSRRGSVFNPEAALKRHSSIGHEGESRRSSTVSVLSVTSDMSRRSSTVSTVSSTSTPPNSRPGSLTRRHSRVKASKKSKVFLNVVTFTFYVLAHPIPCYHFISIGFVLMTYSNDIYSMLQFKIV